LNSRTDRTVADVMLLVLAALIPGIAVFLYLTGWGGVINLVIAMITAVLAEAAAVRLRGQAVRLSIADFSAVVTAVLLALCLPPLLPWWIVVVATLFAILLAKQVYGGLGQNIFNPAMAGYALVLISYPLDLSSWLAQPDQFNMPLTEAFAIVFSGGLSQSVNYDALTGATALSRLYDLQLQSANPAQLAEDIRGSFGAQHSEWLNLAFLAGGAALLVFKVISWHLPVAMITGVAICHIVLGASYPDLTFHLFGGATMLCAFFIITDPVSAPAGNRGRLIFGFLTGVLLYLIRHFGSYPDSAAFAVLLMNCCVPVLDRMETLFSTGTDQ
jgi:electron transport complex protein RnfD